MTRDPMLAEIKRLWRAMYGGDTESVDQGLRLLESAESTFAICERHMLQGCRLTVDGRIDRAERELFIALGLALSRGEPMQIARTHDHLANLYLASGRRTLVLTQIRKATELPIKPEYLNQLLLKGARIASALGRFEEAESSLRKARLGGASEEDVAATRLVNAVRSRDLDRVPDLIDALVAHPPSEAEGGQAWALFSHALALKELGRFDKAIELLIRSVAVSISEARHAQLRLEARLLIVECKMRLGQCTDPLLEEVDAVVQELESHRRPGLLADALGRKGALHRLRDEIVESDVCFERAYELTADGEHPLIRFAIALEHAWLLLEPEEETPADRQRLPEILDEVGILARKLAHPVFNWAMRVARTESLARQGAEEALVQLEECRDSLRKALEGRQVSERDCDIWTERLDAGIGRARRSLRAKLARDIAVMDEVVRGLRSEDSRAHLARFAASIREQLDADRVAMVLLGAEEGSFDVVAARGLSDDEAAKLAGRLLESGLLKRDVPILVRDTTDPDNPTALVLSGGQVVQASDDKITVSLDHILASSQDTETPRSAMAFEILGADVPAGMVYLDRRLAGGKVPFRAADLRAFAFLSNGLAAITRIAIRPLTEENRRLRDRLTDVVRAGAMVTRSARMRQVLERIDLLRESDLPVLVTGESGTGKELVARAVHDRSERCSGPFVPVNCAAIPRELLEAELFGYARGAFTGASRDKRGFFVEANKGTLFLDEIGEMPIDVQAKLLRVIEDKIVTPLGRTRGVTVDFRVVAATHIDLRAAVASKEFRSDLYYRIHGVELFLPPLRERMEDLPLLVERFIDDFRTARGIEAEIKLTTEAWEVLERHDWPGNVRELRNAVLVAAELRERDSGRISLESLPTHVVDSARKAGLVALGLADPDEAIDAAVLTRLFSSVSRVGYKPVMEAIDRYVFSRALADSGGNQRAAARSISIRESTLRQKSRRIGIGGPRTRR